MPAADFRIGDGELGGGGKPQCVVEQLGTVDCADGMPGIIPCDGLAALVRGRREYSLRSHFSAAGAHFEQLDFTGTYEVTNRAVVSRVKISLINPVGGTLRCMAEGCGRR